MVNKKHRNLFLIVVMWVSIILIIFIIGYAIYNDIILPSYISTAAVCFPEKVEKFNFIVTGEVIIRGGKNGNISDIKPEDIQINVIEGADKRTIKHELVHVSQIIRNPENLLCSKPVAKFFTETEAYTMSLLQDFWFEKIYGEIPEV